MIFFKFFPTREISQFRKRSIRKLAEEAAERFSPARAKGYGAETLRKKFEENRPSLIESARSHDDLVEQAEYNALKTIKATFKRFGIELKLTATSKGR